jgi:phenylpropionate dioxygenase-like ring-hydroxylating dioxygenase large terminal subunit
MVDLAASDIGYLGDQELIERIFEHLDHGTTDTCEGTWREPVDHYRSPERLSSEIVQILRQRSVVFCPSVVIPDTGSYLARDAAGVPVVVIRGNDGEVRAFRNACRHRGTSLVSGEGCARSFSCPYHGWLYRLDGSLRHVPDEYGFPGLDKATRGLVALDAFEHGGLVYVNQDGHDTDLRNASLLPELLGSDQVLLDSSETLVEANWKVLTEGFLEGYHLRATHRQTFLPFGYDNLTVVEHSGPNSRVTFPFRRVEDLRDRPRTERSAIGAVTVVDHLFPNVIVARLSHHTTVVVLEPVAVDRTRLVTYQLSSRPPDRGGAADARRDFDFVKLGAAEDRDVALAVQRGLASGANEFLEFGSFEGAIAHFHRQLARAFEGSPVR